jgi:hypothetical protein
MNQINIFSLIIFLESLLFCCPSFSSGKGQCSAKGFVTKLDNNSSKIIVRINGQVQSNGDSSGCSLKDGFELELHYKGLIQVGKTVNVIGTCTNGLTPAGPYASCFYSVE